MQWGLPYGVSNTSGQTLDAEISSILNSAHAYGVRTIDTACLYGESETKLGNQKLGAFQIVSKTPQCASLTDGEAVYSFLSSSIRQSLHKLQISKLYGYMVHHADDLLGPQGPQIAMALRRLKDQGLVEKVGVSVYNNEQLDAITAFFIPDLIQVPINVMDQRFIKNGNLKKMKDLGVEIHARSAYLQGLLLMPLSQVPAYFAPLMPLLSLWHERLQAQSLRPAQVAIAFVSNIAEIDQIIIGVENTQQFEEAIWLSKDIPSFDVTDLSCEDTSMIDPRFWKLK